MNQENYRGIEPVEVPAGMFKSALMFFPSGEPYTVLELQQWPWSVLQVSYPKDGEAFREQLKVASTQGRYEYLQGHEDHIVIHRGSWKPVEITKDNYQQIYNAICEAMKMAASWTLNRK